MSTASATSDLAALTDLNMKIGEAENRGDRDWLAGILAPMLAFQRADDRKTIDDRVAFLQKVKAGGKRVTRIIEPIELVRRSGGRAMRRQGRRSRVPQPPALCTTRRKLEDSAWANEPMRQE